MKSDMDVLEFARRISMLTVNTPISTQYDEQYGQKKNCWWTCQREHLTVWCLYQPTSGVSGYSRAKPNYSARRIYRYFSRPETLLWLAEALGEEDHKLRSVIEEIKSIEDPMTACSIIRKGSNIPFERILSLIENM